MRLLRRLAAERGQSFAYPGTARAASEEIERLLDESKSSRAERHEEERAVREAMSRRGDAAAVGDKEISGYGSSASWGGRP